MTVDWSIFAINLFTFRKWSNMLGKPTETQINREKQQCLTETSHKLIECVWMRLYPNDTHQIQEFNNKVFIHVWNTSRPTRVNKLQHLPIPSTVWSVCRMNAVNKRPIALLSARIRGKEKECVINGGYWLVGLFIKHLFCCRKVWEWRSDVSHCVCLCV